MTATSKQYARTEQVETELPALYNYARALIGAQGLADKMVREALSSRPFEVSDASHDVPLKIALYTAFNDAARKTSLSDRMRNPERFPSDAGPGISRLPLISRQALLLRTVSGFSAEEVGQILHVKAEEADTLAIGAARKAAEKTRSKVLVIGPGEHGRRVSEILSRTGLGVTGPFERNGSAAIRAQTNPPGLVIAKAHDAREALDVLSTYRCRVILTSEAPEALFEGGVPSAAIVVPEPFDDVSLRAAILQATSRDIDLETEPAATDTTEKQEQEQQSSAAIAPRNITAEEIEQATLPRPGPVDAVVVAGQLRLAPSKTPTTKIEAGALEALAHDFSTDLSRLLLPTSNLGPVFTARLQRLRELLDTPLTDSVALRIANQVSCLEKMRGAVEESLAPETASDVLAVITSLQLYVRQFPIWREFLREAAELPAPSTAEDEALAGVADALLSQPDSIVEPALKQAIAETHPTALASDSPAARLAFARALSNPLKAIVRYGVDRAKGVGREFDKELEKQLGKLAAKGVGAVLVGTLGYLVTLSVNPEFAWVGALLGIIQALRK